MKSRWLMFAVVVACKRTPSASTPAPSPGDRILNAQGAVHPHDPWAAAHAKLETQIGKPTVETPNAAMWGVVQGNDCWYVRLDQAPDGSVRNVEGPLRLSKATAYFTWDRCLIAAGVRKLAADDPSAPGPPAQGTIITIPELRDGATHARSKWDRATVSVRGVFLSASRPTTDGDEATTVMMTTAKGDLANLIGCTLADRNAPAPKLSAYDPITVSATVSVPDAVSETPVIALERCSVVRGP